ncbi:hypothetical protein TRVL_01778 [Trypanosoma vivax]|nr:hypothetical protein TRVL_01778 [Trypanosoma vivax]
MQLVGWNGLPFQSSWRPTPQKRSLLLSSRPQWLQSPVAPRFNKGTDQGATGGQVGAKVWLCQCQFPEAGSGSCHVSVPVCPGRGNFRYGRFFFFFASQTAQH